jgi:hypothetical protein
LQPGLDLNEVWVFGELQQGLELPGLHLLPNPGSETEPLQNLPKGVNVRVW